MIMTINKDEKENEKENEEEVVRRVKGECMYECMNVPGINWYRTHLGGE